MTQHSNDENRIQTGELRGHERRLYVIVLSIAF